jgi:rhomboid protease GluP
MIPVTFSQGALLQPSQPTNTFKLQGKGAIAIDAGTLRIEGRSRGTFQFGKSVTLEFPLTDVRNVTHRGKVVRFEIPSAASSPDVHGLKKGMTPFVTLWAKDEAGAAQLASGLGEIQTEEFARASREHLEFEQRLHTATPVAWVTPALVAINVLVFVAMAFGGAGIMKPEGEVHVRWGSNFGLMTASGEWWRLFTSMFLHFGIIHLALNMAALWDIGRIVERLFGNWTFLALYLLAGISGSTLSLLWHPAVNSAGASGAIFGVFGMLAGYLVHKELGLPATVMKKHWSITLPFVGYNLFIGATVPGIDNAAHLGGLVGGFVMGYAFARPLDPDARTFSRGRLAALGAVAVVCIALAVKALGAVSDQLRHSRGSNSERCLEGRGPASQGARDQPRSRRAKDPGGGGASLRTSEQAPVVIHARRRFTAADPAPGPHPLHRPSQGGP